MHIRSIRAEIDYARKWALSRNPAYYDFEAIGGDCTNFVLQCLYAGGAVMHFTRDTGWYYRWYEICHPHQEEDIHPIHTADHSKEHSEQRFSRR